LRKALADAGITNERVDLVAPFGTGTIDYDAAEATAWGEVFGSRLSRIPAVTTRGALGINGAGTGAIDFAATVMALANNTVPPSLNTSSPDPASRFHFVGDDPRDARITHAVTVSYALAGGQTAALVVRKVEE